MPCDLFLHVCSSYPYHSQTRIFPHAVANRFRNVRLNTPTGQYANSAPATISSQTRNLPSFDNPLKRRKLLSSSIRETRNTDATGGPCQIGCWAFPIATSAGPRLAQPARAV